MKRIFFLMIIFVVIMSLGMSVYAKYIEPLPEKPSEYPYIFIGKVESSVSAYVLYYSNIPVRLENYRQLVGGRNVWDVIHPQGQELKKYIQIEGSSEWQYQGTFNYTEDTGGGVVDYVVYTNAWVGQTFVDLEIEEEQKSFFGIDFDYSGFFGDLRVQLGKKEENGTYKVLKEWQYPKGSGHVSIPASEIPQGNKGEYMIVIYEGIQLLINIHIHWMEEGPYCEINYHKWSSYNYKQNVNIRYKRYGEIYIYINRRCISRYRQDREGNK